MTQTEIAFDSISRKRRRAFTFACVFWRRFDRLGSVVIVLPRSKYARSIQNTYAYKRILRHSNNKKESSYLRTLKKSTLQPSQSHQLVIFCPRSSTPTSTHTNTQTRMHTLWRFGAPCGITIVNCRRRRLRCHRRRRRRHGCYFLTICFDRSWRHSTHWHNRKYIVNFSRAGRFAAAVTRGFMCISVCDVAERKWDLVWYACVCRSVDTLNRKILLVCMYVAER